MLILSRYTAYIMRFTHLNALPIVISGPDRKSRGGRVGKPSRTFHKATPYPWMPVFTSRTVERTGSFPPLTRA